MEVHNLRSMNSASERQKHSYAYLIPSLVPHENYERPVVFLDIIVDEDGDTRVELLAHESGASESTIRPVAVRQ